MNNNSLGERMRQIIVASNFWANGTNIHVQVHGPGRAYLRRKRHRDPRMSCPKKVDHVYLILPADWLETVYDRGLMTAHFHGSADACMFIVEAERIDGLAAEVYRVSYAWKAGRRIKSDTGWLCRYGGRNVVSQSSTVDAVEWAESPFLTGLSVPQTLHEAIDAARRAAYYGGISQAKQGGGQQP